MSKKKVSKATPKEVSAKSVKKVAPKKEKDKAKEVNKKAAGDGFEILMGVPDTEYRVLADRNLQAMFSTILGTPGFVKGRIYEISGKSDVGKSALASTIAAKFQQQGETVFYTDAEKSINKDFATLLGYDTKKLLLVKPDYGEAAFLGTRKAIEAGGRFGILDSSGACTPKAMIDDKGAGVGALARLTSVEMPKLDKVVDKSGATLIIISQVKERPGVAFGNPLYVTGGSAVGFHSRVRLMISAVEAEKDADKQQISYSVRFKVTKNHTGPKRTVPFDLIVDNMFRPRLTETAVKWAKQFNLIDDDAKKIAGVTVEGKMSAANLAAAISGKEYLVFEAVDALFKAREAGDGTIELDTSDDTDAIAPPTDNDFDNVISVSDDELTESGTL